MNRKEMITEIARQSGCSKRQVRKKLFNHSAELKRHHKKYKFNEAFLDTNTDWLDKNVLYQNWMNGNREVNPYSLPNTFDVSFFPSGCVVLFNVKFVSDDGYVNTGTIGVRLYSTRVRYGCG